MWGALASVSVLVVVEPHVRCDRAACPGKAANEGKMGKQVGDDMSKVLLLAAPRWVAKVADFGLAKLTDRGQKLGLALP